MVSNQVGKQMSEIMASYQSIRQRIKQPGLVPAVRLDVENQLALMLFSGFMRHTPFAYLQAIPRYLRAIECRLDKQKPDSADVQGLNRLWQRYWQYVEKQLKTTQPQPERQAFRWAMEELRVSLFAQQLKTPYPVSVQRLEKQWNEMF
jgi:ATP-dependent helicase HrpA